MDIGYPNMDPEIERPRGYTETVSGDYSWDQYGLRIKWTEPEVPGEFRNPLNEPLRLRVCVETKKALQVPPDDISAWCWTHMRFQENPYGIWKEIRLQYNPKCTQWDDHGINTYVFQTFVTPTLNDNYRLTFNVKLGKIMIWANSFQIDNMIDIREKPARGTQTTIFPSVHFACNFTDDKSARTDPNVTSRPTTPRHSTRSTTSQNPGRQVSTRFSTQLREVRQSLSPCVSQSKASAAELKSPCVSQSKPSAAELKSPCVSESKGSETELKSPCVSQSKAR
uniref:Uncharacterized protein n=1 Tax=Biomphalaria glabrata TaxID=6526 RepID=A0A2C9LGV7_BIOGL